ncbi:hypothetical protein KKD20_04275 [Patescibacteria group bacterium]|nr:hypothetical protein [Patescibacteria group bacterium]
MKYLKFTILSLAIISCFFAVQNVSAATEFVSTIRATGGDYSMLSTWEAAVQSDLTASTTVVYSGTGAGGLPTGTVLELFRGGVYQDITASTTATTTTQILVNSFSGNYKVLQDGDQWRKASSTANMWTVSSAGLGDSAIAIAQIDGAWASADTTAVAIAGWTTSATNYIKVYTTASARHNGKWDEGKYRLVSANYVVLYINEMYTRVEGLQILETKVGDGTSNSSGIYVNFPDGNLSQISHNIIKSNLSGTFVYAAGINTRGDAKIYNNIIYDFNLANSIGIYSWANTFVYIYNNAVFNCAIGISAATTVNYKTVKNNIAQNCVDGFYSSGGSFNAASNYNISDLAGDAPGANSKNSTNVAFADEANDDFHLAGNDSSARNAGTDLSADFSDDIDGDARGYRGAWDIGADETFSATQINSPQTSLLTNGLVGYWSFNGADMGTTSATDLSGNGNTGWLINGVKKVAGISGQALQFDGVDDYMDAGKVLSGGGLTSLTVSAWIYINGFGELGFVAGKSDEYMLRLEDVTEGKHFEFFVKIGGTWYAAQNTPVANTGIWYHMIGVWDSSLALNQIKIYIDSNLKSSYNISGSINAADTSAYIGGVGTAWSFDGLIDEARVYNRALSADEIGQLYRAGARTMKIDPTKNYKTIIK